MYLFRNAERYERARLRNSGWEVNVMYVNTFPIGLPFFTMLSVLTSRSHIGSFFVQTRVNIKCFGC